ncbi:MAG: DUF5818 domain-containing protein [Terriglobia bacterium]
MMRIFLLIVAPAVLWAGIATSKSFDRQSNLPAARTAAASAPAQGSAFTGRISEEGGRYVLVDDLDRATYQLDDQEKAKEFEGKNVKVTGSLDSSTNTIDVAEIIEV